MALSEDADIDIIFSGLFGYIIMGGSSNNTEVLFISIALFILIAFVSILLHELGHAITGKKFTNSPALIILESMGGRALFSSSNFTRTQHVITIAAGPLMNFILAGIFFLLYKFGTEPLNIPKESLFHRGIEITWIINTLWGIFNLLPVFPLDGGQIMHNFIKNPRSAHKASFIFALVFTVLGLSGRMPIIAIFMGFMAFQNYQIMSSYRR